MHFTYENYKLLIEILRGNGYVCTDYIQYDRFEKCVILRHDVDFNIEKAYEFAKFEYENGIKSTYFVLVSSEFYNLYSKRNRDILSSIQKMGHTIGLHYDEMAYEKDFGDIDKTKENIREEIRVLSSILGEKVDCFSYHRPSRSVLESYIEIENVINSYSKVFFEEFKYLSDSRMHWREPVVDIAENAKYEKLHVLTHPFWYFKEQKSIEDILRLFINEATTERFRHLNENFSNLQQIIKMNEYEVICKK